MKRICFLIGIFTILISCGVSDLKNEAENVLFKYLISIKNEDFKEAVRVLKDSRFDNDDEALQHLHAAHDNNDKINDFTIIESQLLNRKTVEITTKIDSVMFGVNEVKFTLTKSENSRWSIDSIETLEIESEE